MISDDQTSKSVKIINKILPEIHGRHEPTCPSYYSFRNQQLEHRQMLQQDTDHSTCQYTQTIWSKWSKVKTILNTKTPYRSKSGNNGKISTGCSFLLVA